MKLNCIIIDDEPPARKVLAEYIEDTYFLEITGKAENPLKADRFLTGGQVDLIFLDINMPKLTGIEFLRSSGSLPMTIITTAYAEYAVDGFNLNVVDYLVKPFSFERFLKAANKAKEQFMLKNQMLTEVKPPEEDYFFVKCDGKIEKIQYNELLYVEAMLNYVVLHTENRKLMVYITIKSILEQLPPANFLKVHKSFIVNTGKIKSIDRDEINMGKATVPVSQALYETVLKDILRDRMIKR
jgi:DNA-binding LytR/AlgR family response regulator